MKYPFCIRKDIRWLIRAALIVPAIAGLIAINGFLPFPDINDFRGLGTICLLMDSDIKHCINNNWGFAHPLSCWLLTKITGDLFISQRILNGIFLLLYLFLFLKILFHIYGGISRRGYICLSAFLCSPWMIEATVSTHLDIIPITITLAALSVFLKANNFFLYFSGGFISGTSYWFRFHFLAIALLQPLVVLLDRKGTKRTLRNALASAVGVIAALVVPHFLNLLAFGEFDFSNGRYVIAEALGLIDWSYESAQNIAAMKVTDMFKSFDLIRFIAAYVYHFLSSGIFPLLITMAIVVRDFCNREKNKSTVDESHRHDKNITYFAVFAAIAVLPFTLLRGFTFRLEAAFVFCQLPLLIGWIKKSNRIISFIIFIIVFATITIQHFRYWPPFLLHKRQVIENQKNISEHIPKRILSENPEKIICCVEYYNPYNKYKLCNMVVCGGWGTRCKPMIERFGLLDLRNPFNDKIYQNTHYLILPTGKEVFDYTDELLFRNRILFRDKNVIILEIVN